MPQIRHASVICPSVGTKEKCPKFLSVLEQRHDVSADDRAINALLSDASL